MKKNPIYDVKEKYRNSVFFFTISYYLFVELKYQLPINIKDKVLEKWI